jgi:multidrug efflux pump subunit AcrA (membrane-fusion protein)
MQKFLGSLVPLAGAGGVVILAAWGLRALLPAALEENPALLGRDYVVQKGPMKITLTRRGEVKARKSLKMRPQMGFPARVTWLVDEGTLVEKDQVIARFDGRRLQTQVNDTEGRIRSLEAGLFTAEVELDIHIRSGKKQTEEARLAWKSAEKDLEKFRLGQRPLDERRRRADVENARVELGRSRTKNRWIPELIAKGYVAADRGREERLRLRRCEMDLEEATHQLDAYLRYSSPLRLYQLQSALDKAEGEFRTVEKRIEKQTKNLTALVLRKRAGLGHLRKNLARFRDDLQKMVMRAPVRAVVVYGDEDRPWRREEIRVGMRAHRWLTLFTLPDFSALKVVMKIDEADIAYFRPDMPLSVRLRSAGPRPVPAKVTRIPEVASRGRWRSRGAKKQFDVEATLERMDFPFKPGMSTEVEIPVAELPDVLKVPLHALRSIRNRRFVYLNLGTDENPLLLRRDVEVGRRGTRFAEVRAGLSPGDRVFLGVPPVELLKLEEALTLEAEMRAGNETGQAGTGKSGGTKGPRKGGKGGTGFGKSKGRKVPGGSGKAKPPGPGKRKTG